MPSSTILNTLKINKLSEAQFDAAVQQGVIGANDLSLLIDADNQSIQVDTLPTAGASELGNIYQFVGATDQNYTNGYFYKCVSDGASTPTYSWTQVSVQPAGSSLPSQTGNAGKFLTTDGTNASWSTTVGNTLYAIDTDTSDTNKKMLTLGYGSDSSRYISFDVSRVANSISICSASSTYYTFYTTSFRPGGVLVDLGSSNQKWQTLYATKINNGSDITIPTTGGTMALTSDIPTVDQTYNASSTNPQSGTAVAGAISSAISSVYKAAGSVTFANLPNLSSSVEGYVYDISDSFTTTADFVEGAGNTYPAGTNVVCINTAASGQTAVYKWDVLSALADLSGYLPLTGGTVNGTITIKNDASGHYTPSSSHIKMYAPYGGSDGTAVELQTRNSGVLDVIGSIYEHGDILAAGGSNNLGSTLLPWTKIYVKEIGNANGTSISVPDNVTSSMMAVQMSTVPTATAKNDGQVVQYVGTTDSNYTNGYFYKSTTTVPDTATIAQTVGSSLSNLAVDASTFVLRRGTGTFTYTYNGSAWVSGGVAYVLNSHGITYTGTPVENDEITVVAQAGTHVWSQVNVQPAGSSLPSQTGKTGQVLTTDGTNASWTNRVLKNVASHGESVIVGPSANVTTTDGGQNAVLGEYAILASTSVRGATIVGSGKEGGEVLAGWYSTAIGNKAHAGGATEATQSNAIAIGSYANANSLGSIQLGYGTNNDANTLKVGQQINNQWQNYELLSAGGTIPTDRFTTTPSSAGSYVPTITVDGQGAVTRSWTTPSGGASMSYNPTTRTLTFS